MTVVAVLAAGIALGPMPTAAADAGKARFAAAVKRAASARAERVGLRYPPAMWRADCRRRSAGGWRCAVGTGGQVLGSRERQRRDAAPCARRRRLVLRMTTGRSRNYRSRAAALFAALVLGSGGVLAAAVVGKEPESAHPSVRARATVQTTEHGLALARQIDRPRGLIFEVESSDGALAGSSLYVKLTRDAPASTRTALRTRPLVGTCDMPGEQVGEFAGRWNDRAGQYGTALITDDPRFMVARRATTCGLCVGAEEATKDTAVFPRRPISRVRMH